MTKHAVLEPMVLFFCNLVVDPAYNFEEDDLELLRENCRNIVSWCGRRPSLDVLTDIWRAATTAMLRNMNDGGLIPIQSAEGIGTRPDHLPLVSFQRCPYRATVVQEYPQVSQLLLYMVEKAEEQVGLAHVTHELKEAQLLFMDVFTMCNA